MVRKRAVREVDLCSSGGSETGGLEDVQCSQLPYMDYDSCEYLSDTQLVGEDDSSSDNSSFDRDLYEKCLKDLQKMKNMKRRLQMAMKHKSKKKKIVKKSNDGFTKFSPTAFMNVISALSPEKTAVIESYGFGSLFLFNIDHIKDFNWCGFVLEWLLDHIKAFNRGKNDRLKRCQGLGGCLYYLVVVYLDHIDFRQRQVADCIPRISVWKQDMIQFYCSLDLRSLGVYGYRPLLEFEKTCYYKAVRLKSIASADDLDSEFCDKMESVSGCKLPFNLKLKISKLIDEHCFNCGLSVNMDITSLGNVSKEFQDMFAKMLRHICRADVRTKELVLNNMEAIAQTDPTVDDGVGSDVAAVPPNVADSISDGAPEEANVVPPKVYVNACVASTSRSTQKNVVFSGINNVIDVELEETMRNLKKSSSDVLSERLKSKSGVINATVDNPLYEITNVGFRSGSRVKTFDLDRDVIPIDKENVTVPDSVSPSPFHHRSRFVRSKV